MARKKINYKEGSCIAIPLREGGFARGIVARMDGKGGILGYFFGPKSLSLEDIEDCSNLKCQDAILTGKFGDPGLLNGEWTVIGEIQNWDKTEWPMPAFIRIDEFENRAWLSYYDEYDFSFIKEKEVPSDLKDSYPYDRDMGYGAVEIRLTELLT
jgi:hypothetical protein